MPYSKVERQIWDDEKFRRWPRHTRDVWLYLLTCRHQNRLGCFVLDPLFVVADVRISAEEAEDALRQLDAEGRIMWDPASRLVLIVRHLKHNAIENPNVATAASAELLAIPYAKRLWEGLLAAIKKHCQLVTKKGEPWCSVLVEAIDQRLEDESQAATTPTLFNRTGNGIDNRLGNRIGNRMPNPEPEPEPLTDTEAFAKANGAEPRELSEPLNATEQQSDANAILAPLIREHLWLGNKPPKLTKHPGWNMGRELQTATDLRTKASIGIEELAGAIEVARDTLKFDGEEPLTLLIFNVAGRLDRLYECVGAWQKKKTKTARRAGPTRIEVDLGKAR